MTGREKRATVKGYSAYSMRFGLIGTVTSSRYNSCYTFTIKKYYGVTILSGGLRDNDLIPNIDCR
jgi:hypothetical protein